MHIENSGVGLTVPDSYAGIGAIGGRLIRKRIITASGTYIPTEGTKSIFVEGVGGGGSGGGADAVAGQTAISQSGSAGAYFGVSLTEDFDGAEIVIGTGGAAPSPGNNAGNNGAATTFTTTAPSSTVFSASGGLLGSAGVSAASSSFYGPAAGAATPATGDIKIGGGSSEPSFRNGATQGWTGNGGDSMFGKGGRGASTFGGNTSMTGAPGTGFGSGGSGGVCEGTGAAVAGGKGADGVVIIYEYDGLIS
jgi:hypothetical protein